MPHPYSPYSPRETLEQVRLLQRTRERVRGLTADLAATSAPPAAAVAGGNVDADIAVEEEGGEELVLQDTFAQESAVTEEDPHM